MSLPQLMIPENPTNVTLLMRVRDHEDQASWSEFAEVYTPLLYAYCQKRSITPANASDIIQEVMRAVAGAIQSFEYDPSKGKFRGWLFTILRHEISRFFKKAERAPVSVDDQTLALIQQSDLPSTAEVDRWDLDYQKQLLAWAIESIREEVSPHIYRAFYATAIEDKAVQEVAAELGISNNAVGVAKHRVFQRVKAKVLSIDGEGWESDFLEKVTPA